jgi:glycosyltransferase involved in cell wall biosynthesis
MARKIGIQYATGDYVLFLDSDDTFEVNALQLLYKKIKSFNADIYCFGYKTIPDGKIIFPRSFKNPTKHLGAFFENPSKQNVPNAVWTRCYKKEVIFQSLQMMEDFNVFLAEDLYMSIIMIYASKKIKYIKSAIVNYSTQGRSSKKIFDAKKYVSHLQSIAIIIEHIRFFLLHYNPGYLKFAITLKYRLLNDFFNDLPNFLNLNQKKIILNSVNRYLKTAFLYDFIMSERNLAKKWLVIKNCFFMHLFIKSINMFRGKK